MTADANGLEAIRLTIRPGETVVRVRTFWVDGVGRTERTLYRVVGTAVCATGGNEVAIVEVLEGASMGAWECYNLWAYVRAFRRIIKDQEPESAAVRPPERVAGAFASGSGV